MHFNFSIVCEEQYFMLHGDCHMRARISSFGMSKVCRMVSECCIHWLMRSLPLHSDQNRNIVPKYHKSTAAASCRWVPVSIMQYDRQCGTPSVWGLAGLRTFCYFSAHRVRREQSLSVPDIHSPSLSDLKRSRGACSLG